MHMYFAYGMNTDPRVMPEGSTAIGAATLEGWQFDFRQYADVQPAEGASVEGVLWEVTDYGLATLDGREGYRPEGDGLYDRKEVEVTLHRDARKPYKAIVYFMAARTLEWGKREPSAHYLSMLEHGYEKYGVDLQQLVDGLIRCGAKHMEPHYVEQIA